MCRFLVYKGKDEILLSKLILEPAHSILTQSYDSRLRLVSPSFTSPSTPKPSDQSTVGPRTYLCLYILILPSFNPLKLTLYPQDTRRPHNGDGFGVGYYTPASLGPTPCIFTSTIPAWNCINLSRLASKTASALIFAHVRATTEGTLADINCHPFTHSRLMFMHNGNIGAWKHVKRPLAASLADRWFLGVQGGTDSEWAFALFLDRMARMGVNPDDPNVGEAGFGHGVLRRAMLETIAAINTFIKAIPERKVVEEGLDTRSLLNFAVTDGQTVVCTRYVSSATDEAASLYFSSGTSWRQGEKPGEYKMERQDKGADIVLVASEPLTFERDNWVTVPTNSVLTVHGQTVLVHPIVDEYYNHSPSYARGLAFAESKGLVSGGPGDGVGEGVEAVRQRLEKVRREEVSVGM